jgi:hypothetical protein
VAAKKAKPKKMSSKQMKSTKGGATFPATPVGTAVSVNMPSMADPLMGRTRIQPPIPPPPASLKP